MKSFIIYIFIIFIKYINSDLEIDEKPNYIKFPFKTKIKSFSQIRDISNPFNESTFISTFLRNNIFISISMGTPPQNINATLDKNEKCFSFGHDEILNNIQYKSSNDYISYNQIIPYNRQLSTSSKQIINTYELEEEFYLYQYSNKAVTNLLNSTTKLRFLYKNNALENTYGKIGLNMNYNEGVSCPNFMKSLKNKNIIPKYIFSFDFYSLFDGYFYLGPEPHLFNIKPNINKYYQYVKMKTILSKEGYSQWELLFNKILVKNKTNNYSFSLTIKSVKIDFNLGLIIGTSEYQEIIEQNFFNLLIDKNICKKTLVDYDNEKYYIYGCSENLHQRKNRNSYASYFDEFPEFEFFHQDLENSIKLFKHELFEEINRVYYFLIIFEGDKNNNVWKLGHPFLKKHQFIFDYDSKTIGYYDINIFQSKDNKKARKLKT